MRTYKIERGFMAFQFGIPTGVFSVGIECNALKKAGNYHCVVGKSEKEFDISYNDALELIARYGEDNIIKKRRGKNVFIIPISLLTQER